MKKLILSTAIGIVATLPLVFLSSTANAEREGVRAERPAAEDSGRGVGENVQEGVEHPAADAEAIRIARENADDDNDGVINIDDPDDDNNGVPDTEEGAQ